MNCPVCGLSILEEQETAPLFSIFYCKWCKNRFKLDIDDLEEYV